MAAQVRLTQVSAEILVLPNPQVRLTQVSAEALIGPPEAGVRLTQVSAEVLLTDTSPAITHPSGFTTCADPWVFPEPNPFPFPAIGGPQYSYIEEITPDWGEYGQEGPDGIPEYGTVQTSSIRRFSIEYDGLSQSEARQLDQHFSSTKGGVGFTMLVPRTGETITNCRYESYKVNSHIKIWSQSRSIVIVKYTN